MIKYKEMENVVDMYNNKEKIIACYNKQMEKLVNKAIYEPASEILFEMEEVARNKAKVLLTLAKLKQVLYNDLTTNEKIIFTLYFYKKIGAKPTAQKMKISIRTLFLRLNSIIEKMKAKGVFKWQKEQEFTNM